MSIAVPITILATPTPILGGTAQAAGGPPILFNTSAETITLTWSPSGDTYQLGPLGAIGVPSQAELTGTSASGTAVLQVLRGIRPVPAGGAAAASFDEATGSFRITQLNPDWTQRGPIQEAASGLGDGVHQIYFDLEDYKQFYAYIVVTAGTGYWSWKVYAATQNDGTAQGGVDYRDKTLDWFGVEQVSGSVDLEIEFEKDTPTLAKFIKIEGTRSGDAGSSGAYVANIDRSY